MSETQDTKTEVEQEDKPTISRRTVKAPTEGSRGRAGLGVAYDSGARKGERFRIEQLWAPAEGEETGRAEPVYVAEDDVLDLVHAILRHYEWEVED